MDRSLTDLFRGTIGGQSLGVGQAMPRTVISVLVATLVLAGLLGMLIPSQAALLLGIPALAMVLLLLLRFPWLGVYLLALLMPIQYLTRLENQATAIRYLGWLVFAAWALGKLVQKPSLRRLLKGPLFGAMAAFLLWAFVSVLWSPLETWQVFYFSFLQLGGMVIVFTDLVHSRERLEAMLFCVFVGTLVGAGVAIYEYLSALSYWHYWSRALGGFGDGNYSSASYMFVLPYALFLVNERSGWKRVFALVSVPLLLTAVGATASRAGLLSIPLWLLVQFREAPKRRHRMQWFLVVLCSALLAVRFWPWATIEYRMSTAWTGGAPEGLGGRIGLWVYSLEQFIQKPLTGYGLSTALGDWSRFVPHNLFLQVAVRLGLPGLLALVWILAVSWRSLFLAYRQARASGEGETAGLVRAIQDGALLYLFFSLSLDTAMSRLLWLTFALGHICRTLVGYEVASEGQSQMARKVQASRLLGFGDPEERLHG
jgi:O-antigen ligase